MLIYLFYFLFIIVLALIMKTYRKGLIIFGLLSIGVMWLMIGLRSVSIGYDTIDYVQSFLGSTTLRLEGTTEPLYVIATYAIRQMTDSVGAYFLIMEAVLCISLFLLIKGFLNNTIEALIAISLFFLLGIYAFSVAGLRQTIAIGFIVLAFLAAEQKKWIFYVLYITIAYGFHNSSIIMAPMFLLRKKNMSRVAIPLVIGMLLLAQIMPDNIISFLYSEETIISERFGQYGTVYESSQNYSGFFLQLILVVIAYIRRDRINLPPETKNFYFNMAYFGLGFQSMTIVIAEFFRISFYFCIFDIIIVPLALSTFTRNKNTVYTVFMIGCLVYIFLLAKSNVLPIADMVI